MSKNYTLLSNGNKLWHKLNPQQEARAYRAMGGCKSVHKIKSEVDPVDPFAPVEKQSLSQDLPQEE